MQGSFTRSMAWLHTWAGLVSGWVLFAVFVTGTLAVFTDELDRWMRPEIHGASTPHLGSLAPVVATLERDLPAGAKRWIITLPSARRPYVSVGWLDAGGFSLRLMDPATAEWLEPRETVGGDFYFRFHYRLYTPGWGGAWVVGAVTMAMLALMIAGIVIHKRIFKDFFTFRPKASSHRAWLDGHVSLSVLFLPFHLMIAYTGVAIYFEHYMTAGIEAAYGDDRFGFQADYFPDRRIFFAAPSGEAAPLTALDPLLRRAEAAFGGTEPRMLIVENPGDAGAVVNVYDSWDDRLDREYRYVGFDGVTGAEREAVTDYSAAHDVMGVMKGLHRAQFADGSLRWLYFLCGLAGCGMIASGLVLFSVKRRRQHRDGPAAVSTYAVIERLNVAFVAGICVACAALPLANRLLPVGIDGRALLEVGVVLACWLAMLVHALARPPASAWSEQLAAAAALCCALPAVDAIATEGRAVQWLREGEWSLAGVDLTAFVLGLVLAWTAWALRRRRLAGSARTEPGRTVA